jgi:hypothetical protein
VTCHLFTVAILLGALALYAIGLGGGGAFLLFIGVGFELWFWVRALHGKRNAASAAPHSGA